MSRKYLAFNQITGAYFLQYSDWAASHDFLFPHNETRKEEFTGHYIVSLDKAQAKNSSEFICKSTIMKLV